MASPFRPRVPFRHGQVRQLQYIGAVSEDERMKRQRNIFFARNRSAQAGMTLIETMIALAILLVVAAGVMGLAGVAGFPTQTQGGFAGRTAQGPPGKTVEKVGFEICHGGNNRTDRTGTEVLSAAM